MSVHRYKAIALCLLIAILAISCSALADENTQKPASQEIPVDEALKNMCDSLGPKHAYLSKQLAEKPNDLGLRLQYADALLDINKVDEAMIEYQTVVKGGKNNPDALLGLACCYERQGNWRVALKNCAAACTAQPGNADAVTVYLACAQRHGKTGEALAAVHNLAQIDKSKAALCYWTVGGWIVENNYYGAQPFAKAAHELDSKTYPKPEMTARPWFVRRKDGRWGTPKAEKWEARFGFGHVIAPKYIPSATVGKDDK